MGILFEHLGWVQLFKTAFSLSPHLIEGDDAKINAKIGQKGKMSSF
jgi:hypothetical protein